MRTKIPKSTLKSSLFPKLGFNSKTINRALSILLIFAIFINMGALLMSGKDKYFSSDYWSRYPGLKKAYYNSIYANKKGTWLPDEILYSYNGGALITGVSPILVNPEIPPTGKYIIGLSIILFNNEYLIVFIFGVLSLLLMYLVGRQIFNSSFVSLIAPTLITFEPFFKNQFIYIPLIDMFQLFFLLSSFYFFNKAFLTGRKTILWFVLSSIFIGLFISTKFFATGAAIVAAILFVLLINKEVKKALLLLLTLPISVFILLLSYIRVLIIGYPFIKFLGIQKWVLWYNQGHLRGQLSIWPLIFFNNWYQADGKILHDSQWRISWPVSTAISGMGSVVWAVNKKIEKKGVEVLIAWSIFYLSMLSLADATARYLVILLPVLFIISVWAFEQIIYYILKRYENRL